MYCTAKETYSRIKVLHVTVFLLYMSTFKPKGKGKGPKPASQAPVALPLHEAVKTGDLSKVEEYLSREDFDPRTLNITDFHQRSALHLAAYIGHLDIVEKLLSVKSDVHQMAADGFTPLCFASMAGRTDVVSALLKARANVNVMCSKGTKSPLLLAAQKGHVDTVRRLLRKGGRLPEGSVTKFSEEVEAVLAERGVQQPSEQVIEQKAEGDVKRTRTEQEEEKPFENE